jgi:hypothetical protein
MTYLESNGQELTSDYPYTARDGSCSASAAKGKVNVTSIHNVTPQSVDQLKAAIMTAPTSVTVEADTYVF